MQGCPATLSEVAVRADSLARFGRELADWLHVVRASGPERIAPEPWFAADGPRGRLFARRDSPPAFKRRNHFSPSPNLPVRLRAGRPPVSSERRRAKNAERQRRFRQRRRELVRERGLSDQTKSK